MVSGRNNVALPAALHGGRAATRQCRLLVTTAVAALSAMTAPAYAQAVTATGDVDPTELGTYWDIPGLLTIGNSSDGRLEIVGGGGFGDGYVTSGSGEIGRQASSTASVTVIGTNAQWRNTGDLTVGVAGRGSLQVALGAQTQSNNLIIGDAAGSYGSATVADTYSILSAQNLVYIGRQGEGHVTVSNGANLVAYGGVIVADQLGSVGSLSVESPSAGGGIGYSFVNAPYIARGAGEGTISFNGGAITTASATADYLRDFGTATLSGEGLAVFTGGVEIGIGATTALVGTGGITVYFGSQLTLKGTGNTYSGTTTLVGSTLKGGNAGAFSAASTVNLDGGSTLDLGGYDQVIGGLADGNMFGSRVINSGTTPAMLTVGANGSSTSYGGQIEGNLGLTKTGIGTLTLSAGAYSTYSGATIVDGGTLRAGQISSFSPNSAFTVTGTLDIGGYSQHIGSLAGTGTVTNDGAATVFLAVGEDNSSTVFSGTLQDGTAPLWFAKNGTGTLTLTGTNTYSGGTDLNDGTLVISNAQALGTGAIIAASLPTTLDTSAAFTLANNIFVGTDFTIGGSNNLTLTGDVSGFGRLIKAGSANLTLSGASTWSQIDLRQGSLTFGRDTTLYAGQLTIQNGTTLDSSTAVSIGHNVILNGAVAIGGTNDLTLNGLMDGTGSITKLGASRLTLNGLNSFSGGVTLAAGDLTVGNGGALGSGRLTVGGLSTLSSSANITLSNSVSLNAGLTIDGSNDLSLDGVIDGLSYLTYAGSGTLTLNGANTFTGGVTLTSGQLAVGNNSALGAGVLNVIGNAEITTTGSAVTLANSIIIAPGATLGLAGAGGTFNLSGGLFGAGSLTINGGTLRLTGLNSYSGITTVNAGGILQIGSGGAFNGVNMVTLAGGTLDLHGYNQTIGSLDATGTVTNDGVSAATLTTGADNTTTTFSGALIDGASALGLTKTGIGTMTLTGTGNSYTGNTLVSAGKLAVNGSIASSSLLTVASGATLGGSGTVGDTAIAAGGRLAPGNSIGTLTVAGDLSLVGGSILDFELGGSGTLANPASGASDRIAVTGDLTLDGTINLSQSASPADGTAGFGYYRLITYGGTLTDNGLAIGTTPALADPAAYQIQAGSGRVDLFVVAAGDDTLQHWQGGNGSWDATGAMWLSQGGTISVAWAGKNAVFKDAGSFTGGAITVIGDQGFQGLQFVDTGYVLNGTGRLVTDGSGRADGNAEIRVLDNAATIGVVIAGAAGITKTGAGNLHLNGTNTYAGGIRIADGTVIISQDANLGAISGGIAFDGGALAFTNDMSSNRAIVLNSNGQLDTIGSIAVTLGGTVSGASGLLKTGDGTLTLAGANGYTGDTIVEGGTLVGSSASIRGNLVNRGLVIFNEAHQGTFAGNIGGQNGFDGTMRKTGAGVLTLGGTSSLDWDIAQGGLAATKGSFAGDAMIASGAWLTLAGGSAGTYAGTLSGSGIFELVGTSRLTLTTDNSGFAGSTHVLDGALRVDGTLGGSILVDSSATLEGTGEVGAVTMVSAGTLSGRAGDTLTMGSLTLANASTIAVQLGAPSAAALFDVTGDLTLDGRLSITDAGGFGAGVYRLFDYGGALTDNGLTIGALPGVVSASDLLVQTSVAGQVNLVSSAGVELLFWDGGEAALRGNGVVDGGAGTWTATGSTWTDATGNYVGAMRPAPGFAVFQSGGGTVTLDDSAGALAVTGMQFVSDGYRLAGDALGLAGADGRTVIRVGDGTMAGAAITATIASALTGSGDLVKTDRGTLILTGANDYAGNTIVEGGTLAGSSASIRGNIANTGTIVFDQTADASFGGSIAGSGTARGAMIKRGGGTLTLTGASTLDWSIEQGTLATTAQSFTGNAAIAADATLLFDQAATGTYAGSLSGAGIVAIAGGQRLELTGDSRGFTGGFDVREGKLVVSGALGGETRIGQGGMVGGNGTLGATIVEAGGTISPGNSIGLLTVNGDIRFDAGAIYQVEVDPTGSAADRIAATGRAILNGGTVAHIGFAGDYRPNASYVILTAAGGVEGQFGTVTSDFAFLTPSLGYSADTVTLTLDRNEVAFPAVGNTGNQRAVAGAVEALAAGNALYDAVVVLGADQARTAFDSLSGEAHASFQSVLIEDSRFIRSAALDRMRLAGASADASRGTAWWMQGIGNWGDLDSNGDSRRVKHSSVGVLMGVDAIAGERAQLGLYGGWQKGDADVRAAASDADTTSYHLGLYAGVDAGRFGFRSGFALGWHKADITRQVLFEGFNDTAKSDRDASTAQGFAEIGYRLGAGGVAVEPFVGIAHVVLDSEAARERGGAAALAVRHDRMATSFATLGARLAHGFDLGGVKADLRTVAAWRHAFGDRTPEAALAFAGGTPFTVTGAPVARNALSADIGLGIALSSQARFDIAYAGDIASSTQNHSGRATFSWMF